MDGDIRLSTHFPLADMLRSEIALRHGIDNTPPPEVVNELRRLCQVGLEPGRELLGGVPWYVSSGFRCVPLNNLVHGSGWIPGQTLSAHVFGRAADVIPMGLDLHIAFDILRRSSLPFDQLLIECNAWLHFGIAEAGAAPRRQAMTAAKVLKADGTFDRWDYTLVT